MSNKQTNSSPAKFKRYELKYLITPAQKQALLNRFSNELQPDAFGHSTIRNLYYDTDDFLLIRRSLKGGVYKEKLRLRSYGLATPDDEVFLELKKKYKGVVYKRRLAIKECDATPYFHDACSLTPSQVASEIDYFKNFYDNLQPRVYISYERDAFFGKDDPDFRVTFDENILWRDTDLSLCSESFGTPILPEGYVLMELKVGAALPLEMAHFLNENEIYKTSFSKYGRAYVAMKQSPQGCRDDLSTESIIKQSTLLTNDLPENIMNSPVASHGAIPVDNHSNHSEGSFSKREASPSEKPSDSYTAANKLNKKENTHVA